MRIKKLLGSTYTELSVTLIILTLVVAITVISVLKSCKIEDKAIKMSSKTFYTYAELALNEIIRDKAPSGIKYLTSEELMNYFVQYMEGTHLTNSLGINGDCSSFVGGKIANVDYMNKKMKCANFKSKLRAGFYVDSDCSQSIMVKEYAQEDLKSRNVDNACGYIIFEPLNSRGVFEKDLFTIALGNRRFK